jgi:protein O-mannosyl-transferase
MVNGDGLSGDIRAATTPAWTRYLYVIVAACAVLTYLGALWNQWALDDLPIIFSNSFVHSPRALWRTFGASYWPPELGGGLYRPFAIASYALDWQLGSVAWFHAVNLLWHAAASVAVAVLARHWSGERAALVAGLLFAVHPVHVEAVANIVGRAELMAALFSLAAVYAALERDSLGWSLAASAASLLAKENGAVVVAFIVWGWILGVGRRPSGRRMLAYAIGWVVLGAAYAAVRSAVLAPYGHIISRAAQFIGATPLQVRLTGVAAFADFARLLVFPATLRVDYSPNERTLVPSPFDARFLVGLACCAAWIGVVVLAWRRGRRVEAYGLGWIGIALLPVANLVFPVGILIAERTLYLPSAGLALAAGATLARLPPARLVPIVAILVTAGAIRTALRVPVWRNSISVVVSELEDSPDSFDGPWRMVGLYLAAHQPEKALAAYRRATAIYDKMPWLYMGGADAALMLGRSALADSMLARLNELCRGCEYYYRYEAAIAHTRGDSAVADSLLARVPRGGAR